MIPRRQHCGERAVGCYCEGANVVTCNCDCGACGKAFEAEYEETRKGEET